VPITDDEQRERLAGGMTEELRELGCTDEHIEKAMTFLDWCMNQRDVVVVVDQRKVR
jgi:hypothetical protein